MTRRIRFCLLSALMVMASFWGCASTEEKAAEEKMVVSSFKDYPDQKFDVRDYVRGMEKAGHNILAWQDESVDLSMYDSARLNDFGKRFLPPQNKFSYDTFIKSFNLDLRNALKLEQDEGPDALRIEGEIVQCNPGSRAARYWVGFGAGQAGGGAVCEVYTPGSQRPCIRIYSRDTMSGGAWGGDSIRALSRIFNQVAVRIATVLEARIGR